MSRRFESRWGSSPRRLMGSLLVVLALTPAVVATGALGRHAEQSPSPASARVVARTPFFASGSFLALSSPTVECTMTSSPPSATVRVPLSQTARPDEVVGLILALHTFSCRPRTATTTISQTKNWGYMTANGLIREVNSRRISQTKVALAFLRLALQGRVQSLAPAIPGASSGAYATSTSLKAEDFKGCQVYALPLPCGLWTSGTLTVPKTRSLVVKKRKRGCRALVGGRTSLLLCEDAVACTLASTVTLGFQTFTRRCRPRASRVELGLLPPKTRPSFARVLADPRCEEFSYLRALTPTQLTAGLGILADRVLFLPLRAPFFLTVQRTSTGCPKG